MNSKTRNAPVVVVQSLFATLALVLVLGSPALARAQVHYYVSTTGDDINDGLSVSSSFLTIQAAADVVDPGDTVQVLAGTYTGFFLDSRSGTASDRIVFVADPGVYIQGEGAVTCQRHETVCLWESSYITLEGFDIEGRDCGYGQCDGFAARAYGSQGNAIQGLILRNNTFHGGESRGIYLTFNVGALIEGNEIFGSGIGMYFANGAPASFGDESSIIRNNVFRDNSSIAIHVNADLSSGGDGIIRGLTIDRNFVLHNEGQGIHFDGVSGSTVTNNVVVGNNRGIIVSLVDGALAPEDNLIANNTVVQEASSQACLRLGGGATNTVVFNNVFIHLGGPVVDLDGIGASLDSNHNAISALSAVQSATGGDSDSLEIEISSAGFTDSGGDDFSLLSTSVLIDRGIDTLAGHFAPAQDIAGSSRPADNGYDIGAYEFGSADLVILTSALPAAVLDEAYSVTLEAAGGEPPYTWAVQSGTLPDGLALESSAGVISGVPATIGTSTFVVVVADSATPAATALRELTITVTDGAGLDAGLGPDAAGAGDAGAEVNPGSKDGCSCATTASNGSALGFGLLALWLAFSRRRPYGPAAKQLDRPERRCIPARFVASRCISISMRLASRAPRRSESSSYYAAGPMALLSNYLV